MGTFSFSNGLETAAYEKVVHDADTLESFTRAASVQAAYTDGIAALCARRAVIAGDYEGVKDADNALEQCKMNAEARLMLARMGKKLTELGCRLFPDNELVRRWLDDINAGRVTGTYPVAQGIMFGINGMSEEELFCSHDTQIILQRLCTESMEMLPEVRKMNLDQMNAFVPEMDICASLHEIGKMRMFMN